MIGGAGNDRLISRNGRDSLWGGNAFGYRYCLDDVAAAATDELSNADCSYYETNPEECGNWDDDDWTAKDFCCICGGGNCVSSPVILISE